NYYSFYYSKAKQDSYYDDDHDERLQSAARDDVRCTLARLSFNKRKPDFCAILAVSTERNATSTNVD
ncbi:hypothetical protein L9F63_011182, partial [Diploptera punctata]